MGQDLAGAAMARSDPGPLSDGSWILGKNGLVAPEEQVVGAARRACTTGITDATDFRQRVARIPFYRMLSSRKFRFTRITIYVISRPVPCPSGGAMRIVTFRWARDAMDAGPASGGSAAGRDAGLADGEVVWSWRRDRGVDPRRPVLARQR